MNDPNVDLDETLADLFGAERRHPGPPPGAQDRIRAAVAASIGAAIATGSGAAAATSAAASSVGSGAVSTTTAAATSGGLATTATVATSGLAAKLGGGAAIVAALAGTVGGAVFVNSYELEPSTPAVVVVDAAPARPLPPAGLVIADDVAALQETPKPAPTTPTKAAPTKATHAHAAPIVEAVEAPKAEIVVDEPARTAALAAERRQLAMARAALTAGDGRQALALLDGHRVTWPAGQLVEEREALIVLSLAHLGKDADAHAAATVFRATYPRSLFMFAIDRAVP